MKCLLTLVVLLTVSFSASADLLCAKIRTIKGKEVITSKTVATAKCPKGFRLLLDLTAFKNDVVASVPAFNGAAAGGVLNGTYPNPDVADGAILPEHLSGLPNVLVKAGAESIPNVAGTDIAFTSQYYDSSDFFDSGSPENVTIPRSGSYLVTGSVAWVGNAVGVRNVFVTLNNASTFISSNIVPGTNGFLRQVASGVLRLSAGDVLRLRVLQSSGADLSTVVTGSGGESAASYLSLVRVGP